MTFRPPGGGGGGGTPGGSDKQIQYNNAGSFDGVSNGTTGQVLTSNGASATPTFQDAAGGVSMGVIQSVFAGNAYTSITALS